jgi:hypothetical protein
MHIVELHVTVNYVKILSVGQQRQIYVADNNATYVGLRVMCSKLHWNKSMFNCSWPSLEVTFGSLGRNMIYVVSYFLSLVSVAFKNCTKSEGINIL